MTRKFIVGNFPIQNGWYYQSIRSVRKLLFEKLSFPPPLCLFIVLWFDLMPLSWLLLLHKMPFTFLMLCHSLMSINSECWGWSKFLLDIVINFVFVCFLVMCVCLWNWHDCHSGFWLWALYSIYTTALKSIPSISDLPFHIYVQVFAWDSHKWDVLESYGSCLPYIPSFG